jgi:methylated-DNA-[protein]-cysteine S-methyltransferase
MIKNVGIVLKGLKVNKINIQYYKTPYAEFILGAFDEKLCMLDYRYRAKRKSVDKRLCSALNAEYVEKDSDVLVQTRKELDEYLRGERKVFNIALLMLGSEFQKSVWEALLQIPYGKTASYLELSKIVGNEKAVRAVANANGANAISIIIPCHRIIGTNGKLTGYAGGLPLKKKLLALENNLFTENL